MSQVRDRHSPQKRPSNGELTKKELNRARQAMQTAAPLPQLTLDPAGLSPRAVLQLQRVIGNQAVQRMLAQQAPVIQRQSVVQDTWPAGVKRLTQGIDTSDNDATKLDKLVQNFDNIDFTYTMWYKSPIVTQIINTGAADEGDCQVLSEVMAKVATEYLNIVGVKAIPSGYKEFMVWSPIYTIDVNKRPNVNQGQGWNFSSHTIVDGPGGLYDPLFAAKVNKSHWHKRTGNKNTSIEGTDVYSETFDDDTTLYNVFVAEARMEWATQTYLEQHPTILEEHPRLHALALEALYGGEKKKKKKSWGCYITTACVEARGLPDNCRELTVLRGFRDHYVEGLADGPRLLDEYYRTAPRIVRRIQARRDASRIWEELYGCILAAVDYIERGENEAAFELYCAMTYQLKDRFLASV